ncbi:MAG TPA: universal stress protein [Thermoanaerobaculia bacterium]|nr:universal stress protein [Thermoanaerobaculia bacterium]
MPRPDEPRRRDPESYLKLAAREHRSRGKLKVYIGMAAGVGKTMRMINDAHHLRAGGSDVVLGFIETHGRAETAAAIRDLEVVPRKQIQYKGVTIEEMDLEAILARKPDTVVVDELPHTNEAGSKNEKRWQDVEDILDAGIDVLTAMNVQHLEGVQDVVRSVAGLDIRERVPDRIIREADSVIVIDLPIRELRERMRAGKIYPGEQAQRALDHFFQEKTLLRLRELALLQTADYVDTETGGPQVDDSGAIKIAVAIPFDPITARALLLRASRIAGRMNTRWYALYVRRARDHLERMSSQQHRQLADNVQLAMSLGASVISRESEDVVAAILDFLAREDVSLLVVGKPTRRGFLGRLAPGIVQRLLESESQCDILVVETAGK